MSIKKRTAHFPLVGGLDSRVDPKLLQPPTLYNAHNLFRLRSGEWAKRHGFTKLPTTVLSSSGGNTMTTVRKLTGRGEELVAMSANSLWSFSQHQQKWRDLAIGTTDWTTATHTVNAYETGQGVLDNVTVVDAAYSRGAVCVVYQELTNPTNKYIVVEESTGAVLVPPQLALGERPKVVAAGGYFLMISVIEGGASSTILVDRLHATTLVKSIGVSAVTDALGTATGSPWFDVQVKANTGNVLVAYRSTGPNVRAFEWNPTTNAASIASAVVVAGDAAEKALGWVDHDFSVSASPRLATVRNDGVTGARVRTLNAATLVESSNSLLLFSPGDVSAVTGWYDAGLGTSNVRWELRVADTTLTKIVAASTSGAVSDFMSIGCLASKAFKTNGKYYLLVSKPWATQPGYYLVSAENSSSDPRPAGILAHVLRGRGGDLSPERNALCSPSLVSASKFVLGIRKISYVNVSGSTTTIRRCAAFATVDLAGRAPEPIYYSGTVFFPGSCWRAYSGHMAGDVGWNVEPETPTGAPVAGATMGAGTYQYVICFTYLDDEGRLWRSSPSPPFSIVTVAPNTSVTLTIKQPFLLMRSPGTGLSKPTIEVYRTKVNGTEFFRISDGFEVVTTGQTRTFADTTADAVAETGQQLYSQGGELINGPPPPAVAAWMAGSRIIALDAEDRTKVWAGKEFQPGFGAGFHSDLAITIDADGPNFAGAFMDGRNVVFKRQSIWSINGDWPNANGSGPLPIPQRVAVGFGTTEPESVCVGKDGVYFKDPQKGICLLGRDLSVSQIGKPATFTDAQDVVAATMTEQYEQVRFLTATSNFPVYDYLEKQWASWSLGNAITRTAAAVANNGTYYIGDSAGGVFAYDPTQYDDDGSNYAVALGLSLQLGNLGGSARLYRVVFTGTLVDPITLDVRAAYDFAAASETRSKVVAASVDSGVYMMAWRPTQGRMTRLALDAFFTSATAGVRFSSVAVEYGLAPPGGLRRLRSVGVM